MNKPLVALGVLAATSFSTAASAANYNDLHNNDYKWMQFNVMYALHELPGKNNHDYLEMEFGGRSGIFDLYGYFDVFNLTNSKTSDKYNSAKMFLKFAPRISLNAVTGKDLSFGPVKELYLATLINLNGGYNSKGEIGVDNYFIGPGSDIMVPWLGKMGLNLYALYDMNTKDWNGYQISTNWIKPFYTFSNGTYISYQGYIDYQFGMKRHNNPGATTNGGVMYNGIVWHSTHYAVGYGLKGFYNVYGIKNSESFRSTGIGHYFSVSYKF